MNKAILFNFQVDREKSQIRVERSFDAPLDLVWSAWTESEILDRWWAPKPWKTETKSMDFREGGHWLYAMIGPNGETHWNKTDYISIYERKSFIAMDGFCDSEGNLNLSFPRNKWENEFVDQGGHTLVNILLSFESLKDLETIIEMGFREGFTAGLENLDQYISAQFYLRKQNKVDTVARVSTYLNFPGNTEEAFNFYKSVFKTEFINGISRFDSVPLAPNVPPISEELKKKVLHIELPILGGHVLMGTDALKEFGFTVTSGNNVHINLEPESKDEANRLFNSLSVNGKIEMPIQEMFWGAYYGSLTDQFGVNWMVNFQQK